MTPTTAMAPTSAKGKEKMRAKTLDEGYVVVNDQGSPTKRHKGQANVNKNLQEPEEGFFGSTPSRTLFTSSKSSDARNHSNDTPSKPSVATSKWNSSNAEPTPPPPPRTPSPGPGAPSTPSSTVSKTNAILASLHAFQGAVPSIEAHIQLLERRVTAGDRSCEARSKEIVRLKQEIKDKDETLERIWEENRDMKAKMLRQEKKIRSLEEELEHQKTGAREV
ncbi:hypothetical protein FRB98_008077 [Tulasnella sp. 332]|nr:hypothetical protein FRB98_008077 [Tulasnella sp. 332]